MLSSSGIRIEKFFLGLLASVITAVALICVSQLPITWLVLIAAMSAIAASIAIAMYAKVDLTFYFLCIYVFSLPLDISKSLTLHTFADGSVVVKYMCLSDIVSFFMIGSWFVDTMVTKKQRRVHIGTLVVPYLLYVIWSMLSAFNAILPHMTLAFLSTFLKWIVVYVVIINVLNTKERVRILLWILAVTVLSQSVFAVLQSVLSIELNLQGQKATELGRYLFFGTSQRQLLRSTGTMEHPNVFASFLVMVLPLFFAICISKISLMKKLPFLVVLATGMGALVLTFSRGGWIGFGVAIVSMLGLAALNGMVSWKMIRTLAMVCVVMMGVLFPLWQPITNRITKPDDDSTNTRLAMTQQAYMMMKAHPFLGVGLGNYYAASKDYTPPQARHLTAALRHLIKQAIVHNKYMGVAGEVGIVGLLFFLWLLFQIMRVAHSNLGLQDDYIKFISLGIFGGLMGICVAMAGDHFMDNTRNIMFWFVVALAASMKLIVNNERGEKPGAA